MARCTSPHKGPSSLRAGGGGGGGSGGAMVLGKLSVLGRPTNLDKKE